MPRAGTWTKAVIAALVLATHVLFVLLLQTEGRSRPQRAHLVLPAMRITLRPFPVEPRVVADTGGTETGSRSSAPALATPATGVAAIVSLPTAAEAPRPAGTDPAPPVDWTGKASAIAARVAEDAETAPSFGPALQAMRQPCTSGRQYDKATRELMEPLLPEVHDPVPPGGIAAAPSSVRMGGARVGIVRFGGGKGEVEQGNGSRERKPSFRWKWDTPKMGNGGAEQLLTSGWAEPVAYDGMFDDMLAGRTPQSSVPHPELCD
jgi:hypothetical protein